MRFLTLTVRNLKETYRDPLALGFLLGFPLVFMLLFGAMFGGDSSFAAGMTGEGISYIDFMGPGIIVFGLLILIPTSARIMVRDRERGFMSRMLTTPTHPVDFVAGYSLCLAVIAIAQIIIIMAVARAFGMNITGNLGLVFLVFLLAGLSAIGVGMVVASVSRSENRSEPLCWLIAMPMSVLSGGWFSIEMLPVYLRNFAGLFPFAHAIEASRTVLTGGVGLGAISGDVVFLVGWAALIFGLGVILFGRSMRS